MRIIDGRKLREIRKASGLSAMKVATRADTNNTYVYKLEAGYNRARDETVEALARALDVHPADFSAYAEGEPCDAVKLARALGVSRVRIYQYLEEGRVAGAYKEGRNWVLPDGVDSQILKEAQVA